MASSNYYRNLITHIARRSVEATTSILGISDRGLREHLINELGGGKNGLGLLADPVFEAMFPWEKADKTMFDLSGNLLSTSLVNAMDNAGDHRFGKDWYPFRHQLQAWNILLNSPNKSLVVTSGTGSGKTECFMVPILNDLATEYEYQTSPLVGVRALFIYPLNALINSQRERLRAWTDEFNDGLRFCLYNGNTEENKHRDQGRFPNEILTRKQLRETPPPMLVTNATMLEYMLVRQIDEPIIEQSRGKLRWIVLDEAHTYLGSQAAELSLLLRRVMHAFEVEAKDVRFVATSATIGSKEADSKLQEYLANLSGINVEQVVVIGGKRSVSVIPQKPPHKTQLQDLLKIDNNSPLSEKRYDALASNPLAVKLRSVLAQSPVPQKLSELSEKIFNDRSKTLEVLKWLDLCSYTSKPGPNTNKPAIDTEPFLPLRAHLFHQVLSGLWCCVDKNCSAKTNTALADGWLFGRVYTQRRNHCECGAPIFELLFCNECNTPHLLAVNKGGYLAQLDKESVDEFSLDYEDNEEVETEDNDLDLSERVIIAPVEHQDLTYRMSIDKERNITSPGMETLDIYAIDPGNVACSCCESTGYKSGFYRRSLLGTPFYISNNIPLLLDACQESEEANDRPNRGRRLITFTDSRQGTARISTKIQQDSERDSVRGLIYRRSADNFSSISSDELKQKQLEIEKYDLQIAELNKNGLADIAVSIEKLKLGILESLSSHGVIRELHWNDAVSSLQASQDVSKWIFDYYKDINPQLFPVNGGSRILTEMLLLREFARRPKRQNSMETLGLVSVQYPILNEIKEAPGVWIQLGLTINDWKDFLKVALDFYIRENSIIDIPPDWVNWMGAKIYPKTVLNPESTENTSSRVRKWPQVAVTGRNNRLVRMLSIACDIDPNEAVNKDRINAIMKEAWSALTKRYQVENQRTQQRETRQILTNIPGTVQYHLSRSEIAFKVCKEAWVCPYTHRLIDTTFKALSPYIPFHAEKNKSICRNVKLAVCDVDTSNLDSESERKLAIRNWVWEQSDISDLRKENLWTDISDRIVEGGKFYRAVEHSAQQPASRLEKYEALFKTGKLNVMSCSTTMEMGVDIGGISVVALNNVPPHPANYLQRSGRAGRRGETQALAFTTCKDNPHERGVFSNPLWPFETTISAPYITLNSSRIVQRHINSLLLSYFLKKIMVVTETSLISLNCQWFFTNEQADQAPVERMLRWLKTLTYEEIPAFLNKGICQIIRNSILENTAYDAIINNSLESLEEIKSQWLPGYKKLQSEIDALGNVNDTDPYKRKISFDLKSLCEQFLLSELTVHAFLPGYGFPTGIATFDHYSISDFKRGRYVKNGRIDNITRMRDRPGRDMAVAIREYAPGSDIVLDGLVYKSAGILLNKFSPNEDYSEPQKMMVEWRCDSCGYIDNQQEGTFEQVCTECGERIKKDDIREYIEPFGFAVDFYSTPTTDISTQFYIPVKEPWVTAHSEITALFEPKLGIYRNSTQGHVFNHSSGEFGNGYAVCLRCGRSESMTIDNEYPDNVQPGVPHKKLQGKFGPESSSQCEGPDDAYAIQKGIHLGSTDQTDVFELYLKHPDENNYIRHHGKDTLPWTLAVVFRQALADIHGINADEIGYTVKPSKLPGCNYPVAGIVLYDKNGGGAGFSSAAPRHIQDIMLKALNYLDCSDDCDSACQSCLMGYDTRFHIDVLNRHVAIDYLNKIIPFLEIKDEAKLFGNGTVYCFESITSEILANASKGASTLRIYTSGPYSNWDISNSNLKDICLNWKKTFETIELVLPNDDIKNLSDVHKEDIKALENFGIKILCAKDDVDSKIMGGHLLAQISLGEIITSYASSASEVNVPNSSWWSIGDSYLVKSNNLTLIDAAELDSSHLLLNVMKGDIEIEITSECDGPINSFGKKLLDIIVANCNSINESIKSNVIQSITYSDCYVSSPWSLMLLAEILDAIKLKMEDKWLKPSIEIITGDKSPSPMAKGLYAEWYNNKIKSEVIREYFNQMNESSVVNIRSIREMPHGRILTLSWNDGSKTFIRFDHGVGCWSIDKRPSKWFDINMAPEEQVKEMFGILPYIKVKYNKLFPTQIFIKQR